MPLAGGLAAKCNRSIYYYRPSPAQHPQLYRTRSLLVFTRIVGFVAGDAHRGLSHHVRRFEVRSNLVPAGTWHLVTDKYNDCLTKSKSTDTHERSFTNCVHHVAHWISIYLYGCFDYNGRYR